MDNQPLSDRELLEFAAKAAGLQECGWMADTFTHVVDNQFVFWNPLEDDADAFRLMVELDLLDDYLSQLTDEIGGDRLDACRRAIVRAAAEIGRAKLEGGTCG
jgi:hypothetical protein